MLIYGITARQIEHILKSENDITLLLRQAILHLRYYAICNLRQYLVSCHNINMLPSPEWHHSFPIRPEGPLAYGSILSTLDMPTGAI